MTTSEEISASSDGAVKAQDQPEAMEEGDDGGSQGEELIVADLPIPTVGPTSHLGSKVSVMTLDSTRSYYDHAN